MTINLSIILPCYNEAGNLPLLLEGYRVAWPRFAAELILVDNGSTDATAEVLARDLARPEYAFARSVRVEQNQGYGHGIFTGLQAAQGEFLAYSHADMQCRPADVFRAYRHLARHRRPGRVLVKGRRAPRDLPAEMVTGAMGLLASAVLAAPLTDINAQPKVFHRSHLANLSHPPAGFQFDLYLLYRARQAGLAIKTIPVVFGERAHGQSKSAFNLAARRRTIWETICYIFQLRAGAGQ